MATGFKVFLISPLQVVIYSFSDSQSGDNIYNAGSLESIWNPRIDSFKEISGVATSRFGVNPVIVGYHNDTFEILYAPPGSGSLFRSDGAPARLEGRQVTVTSRLQIPDLGRSYVGPLLIPLPLAEPDIASVQKYIELSRAQNPLPAQKIMLDQDEPLTPGQPISVPVGINSIDSPACSAESPRESSFRSPSPRAAESPVHILSETGKYEERLKQLQEEITELRSMVKAFVQRAYKIYPVDCPLSLRTESKSAPVISFTDAQKKLDGDSIERFIMDPLLQAYAGSSRNNNRLVTLYGKNGEMWHVRAEYNPKENKIAPPK